MDSDILQASIKDINDSLRWKAEETATSLIKQIGRLQEQIREANAQIVSCRAQLAEVGFTPINPVDILGS